MVTNQALHTRTALAEGLRELFKQLEERLSLRSLVNVYLAGGMRAMKSPKEADQHKVPPPPKNYGADISFQHSSA